MELRDRLLGLMDRKDHPSWHRLASGQLRPAQLLLHYQQEWLVYVRDFPVLLARVLGKSPPTEVRRMLAENLYEEQTGGLSLGRSHAEMFLEMMEAVGFSRAAFTSVAPLAEAEAYRAWLDHVTLERGWLQAAAVVTIFVEGSVNDRGETAAAGLKAPPPAVDIERMVHEHPLVRHYGADAARLTLIRAHRQVEGGHRRDAWSMVLGHVATHADADAVVRAVETSLALWLLYRESVTRAMDAAPSS
ncbi:MAG: iron-containing redox enzyme family protein [Myxococcota bacterium]